MTYEKYCGQEAFVSLADQPITHIAPKAFLSCKRIQSLTLPDSLEAIGDWAFAHMQQLTDLYLPAKSITFGKKVFLDCEKLQRIHVSPNTSGNDGLPQMLAATVTILQDMVLLQPLRAGCEATHGDWLTDFDTSLQAFIESPDEQNFEPIFYGWFNDEDADSTQLPKYLHKRRRQKLYLTFLRLRYSLHLSDTLRQLLLDYLADHMPEGKEAHMHTITWELLPQYCREEIIYIQLLEEAGALTVSNIPAIIEHLKDASPEIIAYLLRLQNELQKKSDFFDKFAL